MPRRTRRTIRKLTCWSADEWTRIEGAVPTAGVPALRFVREAALEKADALRGGSPPPAPAGRERRASDELVHQLARVLNNLHQLHRVAENDGDDYNSRLITEVIRTADAATADAPERSREASALLAELGPVGVALNDVAHSANVAEHIPDDAENVLVSVLATLTRCLR
jgi:predicted secreted protein